MEAHLSSRSPTRKRALGLALAASGDERLAKQVSAGSERAFAVLYERYHQQIYRYCRSILHNDADAQDALQSTFAAALGALQRAQRSAPLRPWLFRIAHNETISLLRRRGVTAELSEWEEPASGSTEEHLETRERLAQVIGDLQELPERQRSALVMRELSGLSHEEIAVALETTSGAAKQAIFDARQALAEYAEGRAMSCEDVRRAISDGDRRALRARRMRAHLRDCDGCAAFAGAITTRSSELRILAPPLAPAVAAGLLAQLTGGGVTHAGGGLGAVATAGAGKTVGATLASKALVGVAVVAAATAGASTVLPHLSSGGRRATPPATRGHQPGGAPGEVSATRLNGGSSAPAHPYGNAGTTGGARSATNANIHAGAGSRGVAKGLHGRGAPAARAHAKQHHGRATRRGAQGSHGATRSSQRAAARRHAGTKASGTLPSGERIQGAKTLPTRSPGSGAETNSQQPAVTETATTGLPAAALGRARSSPAR